MKIQHKIKELEAELEHIKKEPGVNWLGKWAKSVRTQSIQKRIRDLKKKLSKQQRL